MSREKVRGGVEKYVDIYTTGRHIIIFANYHWVLCLCMCVCVSVSEREGEEGREGVCMQMKMQEIA